MKLNLVRVREDGELETILFNESDIISFKVNNDYDGYNKFDFGVYRDYTDKNIFVIKALDYNKKDYADCNEMINFIFFNEMENDEKIKVYNTLRSVKGAVVFLRVVKGGEMEIITDGDTIAELGIDIFETKDVEVLFKLLQSKKFNG